MEARGVREIPFDLADVVDRPGLRRLDDVQDAARRARLRAELDARATSVASEDRTGSPAAEQARSPTGARSTAGPRRRKAWITRATNRLSTGSSRKPAVGVYEHAAGWAVKAVGAPPQDVRVYSHKRAAMNVATSLARAAGARTVGVYDSRGRVIERHVFGQAGSGWRVKEAKQTAPRRTPKGSSFKATAIYKGTSTVRGSFASGASAARASGKLMGVVRTGATNKGASDPSAGPGKTESR